MENKEFARDLEERTKKFAVSIIRLSASVPNTPEGLAQLSRLARNNTFFRKSFRCIELL